MNWFKGDNIIFVRSGGVFWFMVSWIIGDIDYVFFFGVLFKDRRREKFYFFWVKSLRII